MRLFLPLVVVVQAILAVGVVIGLTFLFPSIDPATALYLSTGAPALTLITVGVIMVPQIVSQAKERGSLEYMRSLPVPRMAYLAADATVWLLASLPGVAAALMVAALRFDLHLAVSPLVVPAMLLVALTATAVGYAIASLLPPMAAVLATNVLVFFVLLFSPVNFPADRLPGWLAELHRYLPVQSMAEVVRGTLAADAFPIAPGAWAVLGAWCAGGFAAAYVLMTRRR
jgi:ABC-2 type transport system permease protein